VISGYVYNGRPSVDQQAGIEQIAASGIPVVLANRGGQGRIPVDWNDPYTQGRTRPASFSHGRLDENQRATRAPTDVQ
jgi:hypothetical protein